MYKTVVLIFISVFSLFARAEVDLICWTSPTIKVIADFESLSLSGNKKGATGSLSYKSTPGSFSGICNNFYGRAYTMIHYVDLGPMLLLSTINAGWYRLSDDLDIKIYTESGIGNKRVYFPALPKDGLKGVFGPGNGPNNDGKPEVCRECIYSGFGVAGSGVIEVKLRRNIIGGAIVFPRDMKLFTAYRVADVSPYPNKPNSPMVELYTSPEGL